MLYYNIRKSIYPYSMKIENEHKLPEFIEQVGDEDLRDFNSTMFVAAKKLALIGTPLTYDPVYHMKVLSAADVNLEIIQRQLPIKGDTLP